MEEEEEIEMNIRISKERKEGEEWSKIKQG